MDSDQRDRRDPHDEDAGASAADSSAEVEDNAGEASTEPIEPVQPVEPTEPTEPVQPEPVSAQAPPPSTDEPAPEVDETAPAEIESWPSQDATAQAVPADQPVGGDETDWRSEPESAAWPTEPPAAGSAEEGTWPTTPPERGDEPILEPAPIDSEPPPSEVEAYPAAAAAAAAGSSAGAAAGAHTVPEGETATGESTQCPRCGTENRPGLAFCRNCGQRLVAAGVATTVERPGTPEGTMACPRCGTHNRAGVAFCQNCGANLRGAAPGYVPPAAAVEEATDAEVERRGAVLGPVVLLIGVVGLITAYLLPFAYGTGSLFERTIGADGYGIAFWNGYPDVGGTIADQAYFGLAAPSPILGVLLVVLAVAGFARATPGRAQVVGLVIALLWSVGLIVLFLVAEVAANWSGDLVGMLRELSPAGIIFFLSSLIIVIGCLTRFGRS
jgi:Double zinc ribbon